MDEEELYGDLSGAKREGQEALVAPEEYEKERKRAEEAERKLEETQRALEQEHSEKLALQSRNGILLKNISSLFKTATHDLSHKTELVASLREQLFQLDPSQAHSSSASWCATSHHPHLPSAALMNFIFWSRSADSLTDVPNHNHINTLY